MSEILAPWDREQLEDLTKKGIERSLPPKESRESISAGETRLTREMIAKQNMDAIIDQIRSNQFENNTKRYLASLNPDKLQSVITQANTYIELFGSDNQQDERAIFAVEIINLTKRIKQ